MSETAQYPVESIFEQPTQSVLEMQRTAIRQSHEATRETVEAQKAALEAAIDGADAYRSVSEQGTELSKGAVFAYLDAIEAMNPGGAEDVAELRTSVDEQFDAAAEIQRDAWNSVVEAIQEGNAAFAAYADSYLDAVDTSFDTFLDAHEQVERGVESVTGTAESER